MSNDYTPDSDAMPEESPASWPGDHQHAPGPNAPEQQLDQLKQQLEQDQSEISVLTKHAESLQSDISDLEKVKDDIEKALAAYGEALPELKEKDAALDAYFDTKMKMILAAIGENKRRIDRKIERFDNRISEKEKRLQNLDDRKAEAKNEYEAAQKHLEEKQQAFDTWKNFLQKTQQNLAGMQDLKKDIEEADDKSEPAAMYFLAKEMQHIKERTHLVSQDEMKGKLYRAWNRLSTAKSDLRDKKQDWEAAQAEYDSEQKELDELKQKRREKILEAIREYNQASGSYHQQS